jgi:hypothetical protein
MFRLMQLTETLSYWNSLPAGHLSFPRNTCSVNPSLQAMEEFPGLRQLPTEVPAALRKAVSEIPATGMIPDALGVCVRMLLRDLHFGAEQPYLDWNFKMSARVFRQPLYRALMLVMSPSMMVSNAAKRWGAFRTGSTLEGKLGKNDAELTLTAPVGLYPPLMLRIIAESFRAAISATGAENVQIHLGLQQGEKTTYSVKWA